MSRIFPIPRSIMHDTIFHTNGVQVLASLGPIHDLTKNTSGKVDYICSIDTEGNQTWQTSTGEDIVASMVKHDHSETLRKISTDITLWLKLSLQEQRRNKEDNNSKNEPQGNIIPISCGLLTGEELEQLEKSLKRSDICNSKMAEEQRADNAALAVRRVGGIRGGC